MLIHPERNVGSISFEVRCERDEWHPLHARTLLEGQKKQKIVVDEWHIQWIKAEAFLERWLEDIRR